MTHRAIRAFSLACLLTWVLSADTRAQEPAREVLAIFEAKCVECHGADLARPKGKFGYVLDLARMAKNPDMVIPGNPDKSELYLMVNQEEMPGDEASQPPLTQKEKEAVREWIAMGAPAAVEAAGTASQLLPPPSASPEPVRTLSFLQHLIRALGQFHPPSSHFPVALLMAALPAEIMWKLTRKRSWKATVRFCVTFGAFSAVVTAILGWCGAAFSNYTGASAPILEWHRWFGTGTAVWGVGTAVLSEFAHKSGNPRWLRYFFRGVLLVGVVLVSVAGYLGASLIYGLHHFHW